MGYSAFLLSTVDISCMLRQKNRKGLPFMSGGKVKTTYTLSEAAHLLSCHPETLRRAIRNGTLRAAKLGREFRFSRSDLEAFWTSRGGGFLFEPGGEASLPPPMHAAAQKKAGRKERGKQLSLLDQPEID